MLGVQSAGRECVVSYIANSQQLLRYVPPESRARTNGTGCLRANLTDIFALHDCITQGEIAGTLFLVNQGYLGKNIYIVGRHFSHNHGILRQGPWKSRI